MFILTAKLQQYFNLNNYRKIIHIPKKYFGILISSNIDYLCPQKIVIWHTKRKYLWIWIAHSD